MKAPFRQQASGYDCTPTTIINGLSYLFAREEIPPFIVQRVYKECLDIESFRGTSSRAIQELSFLLNNYHEKRYKKFAVESECIYGDQVHLKENSKIIRCIYAHGVAVMFVHTTDNEWHCILGFRVEGEWLHCYDPFPRTKRFINDEAVKFVTSTGQQEANLLIRFDWLDKSFKKTKDFDGRKYVFGSKNDRECLLLNRIQIG
jgi:hypothetical protein